MGADEEGKALRTAEYWDGRYVSSDGENPTHEWFRSYEALEPFFNKHLSDSHNPDAKPLILHLGSGDSTIPAHFAKRGYKNQLCLDFSQVVVDLMSARHAQEEGITWRWADVREMKNMSDSSVDVAFDKGTLDAMIHGSPWDPPDIVKSDTERYMKEVYRALKDDTGIFLYITFRQPHFIKPLLNPGGIWELEMETLSGGESSFDYFGFVLRKKKTS